MLRENNEATALESSYYEMKQHKLWFDENVQIIGSKNVH
jgi:hypothetical protein